jgi:predicted adenylyl cyclase CyaB
MPSNVEIKSRVSDPASFRRVASALADRHRTIRQEDTFFNCARGRLKLRRFPDGGGELIHYDRPREKGPKESRYWITPVSDPDGLRLTLGRALGIAGEVRKTRQLYLVGQARVHLDEVEGLGTFAELEVVLQPGQSVEEGESIAAELMRKLDIRETDLIEAAYVDMIASGS